MPHSKAPAKILTKNHQKEILVVILLFAAYTPTIIWMWDRWFAENSYYGHGILVPLVSLYLVWRKREDLKKLPPQPSPWGFRLFILGIIIFWISAILHVYFTSGFSMLIVMAGLVLHFYGKKALGEIRFPLLFLVFMVPLPLILVAFICFKLKIIAAHLATFILNRIGLPAIQLSSIIKMAHSNVLVEDSCGGLRSLISLTALGCIFAYRLRIRLMKKMLLFASAIPIAVITNACRIVFLSAVGEIWGTEFTQGFLHDLSGYLVFVFAFLMLYAVKKLLT
jgi:exosortase